MSVGVQDAVLHDVSASSSGLETTSQAPLDSEAERSAHVRPIILRRETDQILSYYQSAEADQSDEAAYHFPGSPAEPQSGPGEHGRERTRSASPASAYSSSDSVSEDSVSDYGTQRGHGHERGENRESINSISESGYSEAEAGVKQEYGIAIGSPGGDVLMNAVRVRGAAYGTARAINAPTHLSFQLTLPPTLHKNKQREDEEEQSKERETENMPVLAASASMEDDDEHAEGLAPALGRRRRMSSRGGSDKRRVAIVQMDDSSDASGRSGDCEGEQEEELTDGFCREPEALRQQHHASTSTSTATYSAHHHPPSSFLAPGSTPNSPNSNSVGALLSRRGLPGKFALVAPPDASPSAYTNLSYFTPPLSAPAVHSYSISPPPLARNESADSAVSSTSHTSGRHQRSQSEAVLSTGHRGTSTHPSIGGDSSVNTSTHAHTSKRRPGHRLRKGSRDIGIVGMNIAMSAVSGTTTETHPRGEESKAHQIAPDNRPPPMSVPASQLSPIFQRPPLSQLSSFSSHSSYSSETTSASGPGTSEQRASLKEAKYHSQHSPLNAHAHNNSTSKSNGHVTYPQRDENISPVIVGVDPKQMWQAPSLSSVAYTSYSSSSGSQSPSHHPISATSTMTTTPSSPPATTSPVPSPFLYYQPGVHATAGPLPSPPRQIHPPARDSPPPPRPPRLHAPSSGSSSLAKKRSDMSIKQESTTTPVSPAARPAEVSAPVMSPSTTSSTLVGSQSEDSMKGKGHTREGAFPMHSIIVEDAAPAQLTVGQEKEQQQALKRKNTMDELVKDVTAAIDEAAGLSHNSNPASPPPRVTPPIPTRSESRQGHFLVERRSGIELRREESRSTFKGREPQSPDSDYSDNEGDITVTKALPDPLAPSPRAESTDSHEGANKPHHSPNKMLDFALKRFSSLPRPPSRLSVSHASQRSSLSQERHSHERHSHENNTSPTAPAPARPRIVVYLPKIKSAWPEAMQFGDVVVRKSPLERSLGYARKINELANHDPGLGDWVVTTKHNLTNPSPHKTTKRKSITPTEIRSPTERVHTFQPRHPSRGSIGSEMTFPKRVDAYVATDLLQKPTEDSALPGPPTLPYPSLAHGTPVQPARQLGVSASMRSIPSSLGSSKSTGGGGGGFFSSIGRKTSIKKDRTTAPGGTNGAPPHKLLSKRQQTAPAPPPRAVQISAAPSLPGGPRAPPGRVQRAQSVIAAKTGNSTAESENEAASRGMAMKRSPSVAPPIMRNASSPGPEGGLDIDAQVAKLADLLPHADKNVLAGYLRRAGGQDILAIGRYLDDEKSGALRRD